MQKTIGFVTLIFLGWLPLHLTAGIQNSDSLVSMAWNALAQNNQPQAENYFNAATRLNPKATRAYFGLSFLYNLQKKYAPSWQAFERALSMTEDIYPYIYAAWLTPKIRQDGEIQAAVMPLMERLSQKADPAGILKVMANEILGEHYQRKGDLSKFRQYFQNMHAITDWMLIGPFENVAGSGFDKIYPPEIEFDPTRTYPGRHGVPTQWFKLTAVRPDAWIDFQRYFPGSQSIYYANNFIFSNEKRSVQIRIGTSGSVKTFLNDELILDCLEENNNDLETYIVATELQAGWNRLLIKCGYSEINRCNFLARITDAQGEPLTDLKPELTAQSYPSKPGARCQPLENFAEVFFKNQISQNPTHLENYLLQADCYLRNDNAILAELVLRDALKQAPNCGLILSHLLEAYLRGEKYDEYHTTVQKIYQLDPTIPAILENKINEAFENEEYDKAEELINQLAKLQPESETVFQLLLQLYGKKDQAEKIIELTEIAYQKYPKNWGFAYLSALIAYSRTQQYDAAIKILAQYTKHTPADDAVRKLAEMYLKAAKIQKWAELYERLLTIDPAAPGYWYQMANVYFTLQNYDQARELIRKAIEISPGCAAFWSKLGDIYRAQNQVESARNAYRTALKYVPTDFDTRMALRDLEGKKPIFSNFAAIRIDSLIRKAPAAADYPDDGGIILCHDFRRVVYETGASESMTELLIKLFNNRGIDDFKEYWISYNANTENLIIEKSVVIKSDGTEINADTDDNQVVFKSLSPNDQIYLRWRIKNAYSGQLAHHFWDDFYFNSFYPVQFSRYSILVPDTCHFQYLTPNFSLAPVIRHLSDGIRYEWTMRDEPALKYEHDMPNFADVGKILYLSSIPSWKYMVEWYTDLTRLKIRNSFEIKEQLANLWHQNEPISQPEKIKRIYEFVSENIRYSSVYFRQSSYIPQKARDVLVNRIGDCKDKTTLFISMLREIGVDAYYVLLRTSDEGWFTKTLPSIPFNHCIAAVATDAGLQYVDLTAESYPYGTIPINDRGGIALLIKPGVSELQDLSTAAFLPKSIRRQVSIEIKDDHSITIANESIRTGAATVSIRSQYRDQSPKEREKQLTESLTKDYAHVKLLSFELENLAQLLPELRYRYRYEIPNYVGEVGQYKLFNIPWPDKKETNQALAYDVRQFPYIYLNDIDTITNEIEIRLPPDYEPVELAPAVRYSNEFADYAVNYQWHQGILKAQRIERFKKMIVPPEAYQEFKTFWNNAFKEDQRQLLLKKKTTPRK